MSERNRTQVEPSGPSMKITKGSIGSKLIETVDARELHAFLGSGKDFSNWIKSRIEKFSFVEGVDYISSSIKRFVVNNQGLGASSSDLISGANRRDYHVSINITKELSMVERTATGKMTRLYFILTGGNSAGNSAPPCGIPPETAFCPLEFRWN